MRVMLALGGNAMTSRDGGARPEDQIAAARVAMAAVADLLTRPEPVEVVLTHGNGPQVGNLLVKNELAAAVVPPVPLDWCGAQTQATLGNVLVNALDDALRVRGGHRPSGRAGDPHPGGRRRPRLHHARPSRSAASWARPRRADDRARGVLGGPRREGLAPDGRLARARRDPGRARRARADRRRLRGGRCGRRRASRRSARTTGYRGVEAVIDKDLTAALLARTVERRRAGDRHRRPQRGAALRHARGRAAGPGDGRGDARARRRGPLRRRAPWAPRSRPRCRFVEATGKTAR